MLLLPLACSDNPRNSETSLNWTMVCNWRLSEFFAACMNDSSGDMFAVPLALICIISFRWLSSCASASLVRMVVPYAPYAHTRTYIHAYIRLKTFYNRTYVFLQVNYGVSAAIQALSTGQFPPCSRLCQLLSLLLMVLSYFVNLNPSVNENNGILSKWKANQVMSYRLWVCFSVAALTKR